MKIMQALSIEPILRTKEAWLARPYRMSGQKRSSNMQKSQYALMALSFLGFAVLSDTPAAIAQVQPLPPIPQAHDRLVIGGSFGIRYMPVMCIRAQCPTGNYSVTLEGVRIGTFRTLILVRTVDGRVQSTRFEGRHLSDDLEIEGRLQVDGDTATIDVWPTAEAAQKP
ncbi:hypothetical protein [Roseicyclus mahoneyensis]|nr:hypothetical protein [Roseicyclus mahoneyensis]